MATNRANEVVIREAGSEELGLLTAMYETFEPKEVALGLPARDGARRENWLRSLTGGTNYVAIVGGRVAGHLALMPGAHSAEIAVFVHQDFRRMGIGTLLMDKAIAEQRGKGLRSIWVLISSENSVARNGLLKYGFHTAWESLGEVKMEFALEEAPQRVA